MTASKRRAQLQNVELYLHDSEQTESHRWTLDALLAAIRDAGSRAARTSDCTFTVGPRRTYLAISTNGANGFIGQFPIWGPGGKINGAMMFDRLSIRDVRRILKDFYAGRSVMDVFALHAGRFQPYPTSHARRTSMRTPRSVEIPALVTRPSSDCPPAFLPLRRRLLRLERAYNPGSRNLHFAALARVDRRLYEQLLLLAKDGLLAVRANRPYFLKRSLYADDMFWYDLFCLISSAAGRLIPEASRRRLDAGSIPHHLVDRLLDILVDIAIYSTVNGGDITTRNHEALGNTLLAFYTDDLAAHVLARGRRRGVWVIEFVEATVKRVREVRARKPRTHAGAEL